MEDMGLKMPVPQVDIPTIRRKFYAAEREEKGGMKGAKAHAKGHANASERHDGAAAAKG